MPAPAPAPASPAVSPASTYPHAAQSPATGSPRSSAPASPWPATPLRQRLAVLRRARHLLATRTAALTAAISLDLSRTPADTLVAEVLPLLAACRFLEREAARILAPRYLGASGRPLWLPGVTSRVERVPLGHVLIIGPANYPLLLPGVQTLQALAAGNTVTWKPGAGGAPVAHLVAKALTESGLPPHTLTLTADTVEASHSALTGLDALPRPDHIVFTGSSAAGRQVLAAAARTATPVTAELSGVDACFVLPNANHARVVAALTFGMRLNGSATCMAPRRLILIGPSHTGLIPALTAAFATVEPIALPEPTHSRLLTACAQATAAGATIHGDPSAPLLHPIIVTAANPALALCREDLFAPILTVLHAATVEEALTLDRTCPYGLTASIFGPVREAHALAARLTVGTVLVNDLIVPTADPRLPFGGRRQSGFGVTRGAEGLLAFTAPRVVATRRGRSTRHLQPTGPAHTTLFTGLIALLHAGSIAARWQGLRTLIAGGRALTPKKLQEKP